MNMCTVPDRMDFGIFLVTRDTAIRCDLAGSMTDSSQGVQVCQQGVTDFAGDSHVYPPQNPDGKRLYFPAEYHRALAGTYSPSHWG